MVKRLPDSPKKKNKRWLVFSQPSLTFIKKKEGRPKNWRVKKYSLPLGQGKALVVYRRKFITKSARWSKQQKLLVLRFKNTPASVKETAFQIISKRPKKTKARPAFRYGEELRVFLSTILIVAGLFGAVFFGLNALNDKQKIADPETFSPPVAQIAQITPNTKPQTLTLPKSTPVHIRIARLGIDYGVIEVGKKSDETMETPPVLQKVTGWYKYSPTPGELGPSIIVGHVDSYKGPSVFWRLREVVAGDVVEVTRADGSVARFKVDSLQQFEQANFPTEQVYGNIDHAGLRLITCGGTFNRKTQRYDKNTVVFATLVN